MSDLSTEKFDSIHFLKTVSELPGVYRMYDDTNEIIYVGKAKNLKKRLSSYFRKNLDSNKTRALVSQIHHIEVTVTNTETEALILEHNFIKQHKPKYNILLRDDKSYPFVFLSKHKHPRLSMHRGACKLPGEYFGPYPNGFAVKQSLHTIQKIFPIRQCEDSVYSNRSRPCLLYQIKRCAGPCVSGLVDDTEYEEYVQMARLFLQGKDQQVIQALADKMQFASQALKFEDAAKYRDQIQFLNKLQEQQSVSGNILDELDIIAAKIEHGLASIHVLFIRQGKVLGSRNYFPKLPEDNSVEELLYAFVQQFYLADHQQPWPQEILLNHKIEDANNLASLFSELAGHKIKISSNTRSERSRYIQLAENNAANALSTKLVQKSTFEQRYQLLEATLDMKQTIQRMECFDISHTQGEATIASNVVFNRDGPLKSDYRRYNITDITPGDDYAAMKQALSKRFLKAQDISKIPDILFIDGGLGQLKQAEDIISEMTQSAVVDKKPLLIGIAKGESRKPGLETLIHGYTHHEIYLAADNPALHLIQHIRDESHRFAITGHRAKRDKKRTVSVLEEISGIGPKKRQSLIKHFGGFQGIQVATVEQLTKVPGINTALAQLIYDTLH